MTKFSWSYRYVPDGQLEPDRHGRWAIDCYVHVNVKALPQYKWVKEATGKSYMPVRVATMCQKGSTIGSVPSTIHKFCCSFLSFDQAGNWGLSPQRNFFSNDIEELKRIIENEFENVKNVFACTKNEAKPSREAEPNKKLRDEVQ